MKLIKTEFSSIFCPTSPVIGHIPQPQYRKLEMIFLCMKHTDPITSLNPNLAYFFD